MRVPAVIYATGLFFVSSVLAIVLAVITDGLLTRIGMDGKWISHKSPSDYAATYHHIDSRSHIHLST
jgi:hypothetical protein